MHVFEDPRWSTFPRRDIKLIPLMHSMGWTILFSQTDIKKQRCTPDNPPQNLVKFEKGVPQQIGHETFTTGTFESRSFWWCHKTDTKKYFNCQIYNPIEFMTYLRDKIKAAEPILEEEF